MPTRIDWEEVRKHLETYASTSETETVVIPTSVINDAIDCIDYLVGRIQYVDSERFKAK